MVEEVNFSLLHQSCSLELMPNRYYGMCRHLVVGNCNALKQQMLNKELL